MSAAELPAPQIGRILVAAGLLTEEQLAQALDEQALTGKRLGEIVVQRGFMSGPALANALAEQHGGVLKTEYGFASGLGGVAVRRAAAETGASISPLRAPDSTPVSQLRTVDPLAAPSPESELGADREEPDEPPTALEAPVEPFDPTPVQPLLRPAEPPAPVSNFEPEPEPEAPRPNDDFQDARVDPVAPRPPVEPLMPSPWQEPECEPEPVQPLLRPAEPAAPPLAPEPELEPEPEPGLPVAVTRTEEAPPPPGLEPGRALEPNVLPELEPEPALPANVIPTDEASPPHDHEPALAPESSLPAELQLATTTFVPAPFVAPDPVEEAPAPDPEPDPEPEPEPAPEPEPEPEFSPAAAVSDDRDALIDSLRARLDAQEDEIAVLREQLDQERERKDVQVHVWPEEQPSPEPCEPTPPESYLLCVPTPAGYVLLDRVGALPKIGEAVDVREEDGNFTVTKVVRLPRNGRPCAYLQRA